MADTQLKEGERAIIIEINGTDDFQNYLLTHGISLGTVITKNYSPKYAQLTNFTVKGKMISLRNVDFSLINLVRI